MLNLHIRFSEMRYCAFILMGLAPTAWIVVVCLLLLLLLVISTLYLLKAKEVSTLKKEVAELRDTMRMMRYEEANLARMLHTAKPTEKAKENTAPVEMAIVEVSAAVTAEVAAAPVEDEEESPETVTEETAEEIIETGEIAPSTIEDAIEVIEESPELAEDIVESIDESPEVTEESCEMEKGDTFEEIAEEAQALNPHPLQKQSINERRPAIPTDLFAAWFAENEDEHESPSVSDNTIEPLSMSAGAIVTKVAVLEKDAQEIATATTETATERIAEASAPAITEEFLTPQSENVTTAEEKEDERFCRKFERIVQTRMRNPNLNIDIIASQFGMGRTNFYRKVREQMGVSPNDYLRRCRMERAAELLRSTELPISDICAQVGVPDAQYFSKVFKVYFATTPSAYRETSNKQ